MANNLESNPIGINATVYKIQKRLYDKLTVLWNTEIDGIQFASRLKGMAKNRSQSSITKD